MAMFVVAGVAAGAAYLGYRYMFGSNISEITELYARKETKGILLPAQIGRIEGERIRNAAYEILGLDGVNNINVGICGQVKAGKSKLINSMRKVTKSDPTHAKEGETETTSKIAKYPWLGDDVAKTVLWDIPGAGTKRVLSETYFETHFLFIFDVLLLLIVDNLRDEDVKFAEKATEYGVPFAFVRSRCDRDLKLLAEEDEINVDEHLLTQPVPVNDIFDCITSDRDRMESLEKFYIIKKKFVLDVKEKLNEDLKKYSWIEEEPRCFCVSSIYLQRSHKYEEFELEEKELENFLCDTVRRRRGLTENVFEKQSSS